MRPSQSPRTQGPLLAAFLAAALAWAGPASAQAEPGDAAPGRDRGPVSLLLHLGSFSGLGGGLALGTADVGVRASVGWEPLLLVSAGSRVGDTDLQLESGLLLAPDVYLRLFDPRPTSRVGLQGGYRYSSRLGHGAAAGGYAQFAVGGRVDALLTAGLMVFPDGEGRLKRDGRVPSGARFSFPGPDVNLGLSLGLVFSP